MDRQVTREEERTNQIMGMIPENADPRIRAFALANPDAFANAFGQSMFMPTNEAFVRQAEGGGTLYGTKSTSPFGPSSESISGFKAPPNPTKQDFVTLVNKTNSKDVRTFQLGDPKINTLLAKDFVERSRSTAPTVNITQEADKKFETAFAKGMAETQVKQIQDLSAKANLASENEEQINSILTLYNRAESQGLDLSALTGPGAEFKLELTESFATIGGLFGFDLKELDIDIDKITDQQTLRSAFNKLSLQMTKLLKGAISEKELTVASRATANFGNTAEANRIILLTQRAAASKARAVENEAFRYVNKNGNLGQGTLDGEKYNSFTQYQREFVKRDEDFLVKQVIPEINSESEMKALIKIAGGTNALSDEVSQLMNDRLDKIQ